MISFHGANGLNFINPGNVSLIEQWKDGQWRVHLVSGFIVTVDKPTKDKIVKANRPDRDGV